MRHLTSLDVSFGFVGAQGAATIAHHLVTGDARKGDEAAGLIFLNLRHNGIGDAGLLAVAAALDERAAASGARAAYYDLAIDARVDGERPRRGRPPPGVAARDAFARARDARRRRPRPPALTYLDVSSNRVASQGGLALAVALQRAPTLVCVDVSRNGIGADACARLLRAAAASKGCLEVRGARAAGARARDVADFSVAVADRSDAARRHLRGALRTVHVRDDDDAAPRVLAAPLDGTLKFAAGAGPLAAPPPLDDASTRRKGTRRGDDARDESALARAIRGVAARVARACGAEGAFVDERPQFSPAELASLRLERPALPAPPKFSAWTCAARRFVPIRGHLTLRWATAAYPASLAFQWHLVRTREVRGGAADALAAGSRDGDPAPDPDADVFVEARSAWAWHDHTVDVPHCLPNDVLSLWLAPDSAEDVARLDAARLVARDFRLELADAHAAHASHNAVLLDAALLALPFHGSDPLHAFDAR